MRCNICDKALSEAEIQPTPDGSGYEPCSVCMEIILDAAYSDGFSKPDDEDNDGEVDTLDPDTFRSVFDHCDPGFQGDLYHE